MAVQGRRIRVGPPTPTLEPNPFIEERFLSLRSLNGDDLLPFTGRDWALMPGATGLDLPPRDLVLTKYAGIDGDVLEDININGREVFLPVLVNSLVGPADHLDMRDRLEEILSEQDIDYVGEGGAFDLVGTSLRGERTVRCVYKAGWEGDYSSDAVDAGSQSLGLLLYACQPYWKGEQWSTPVVRRPRAESWFGVFPGVLTSTRALGQNMLVTVTGNVASYATVEVHGPATSVTVTAPGLSVSIPGGVDTGETALIITNPRRQDVLFNGVRDWTRVGPVFRNAPLKPGANRVSIVVPGANDATSARVYGDSLYKKWC